MKIATIYFSSQFEGSKVQNVRNFSEIEFMDAFTVFTVRTPNDNPRLTKIMYKTAFIDEITIQYGDDL